MKNCLLLLDPQNDFYSPEGTMYSSNNEENIKKISKILETDKNNLDGIVLMLDSHYIMDISHSSYWIDFEDKHPVPFTEITKKEAKGRKYKVHMPSAPREIFEEKQKMVVEYMESLEIINKKHIIKPDHCLIGTWGHNVYQPVMDQISIWSKNKGRDCQLVLKGLYQHSEHFGAFEAGIPNPNVPETMLNQGILQYLDNFENVYIFGDKEVLMATLIQLSDCAEQVEEGHDIFERYVVVSDDEDIKKYCEEKKYRNVGIDEFEIK